MSTSLILNNKAGLFSLSRQILSIFKPPSKNELKPSFPIKIGNTIFTGLHAENLPPVSLLSFKILFLGIPKLVAALILDVIAYVFFNTLFPHTLSYESKVSNVEKDFEAITAISLSETLMLSNSSGSLPVIKWNLLLPLSL